MALPPGITPKTVTVGIASFFDGTLAEGTVTITAPVNVVHTPSNRPVFSSQMSKRFIDGEASFNLAPTDAEGLNRVDWTYKLNVVISGALVQPDPIYFTLPAAGPDAIDLDALVPVPSSAGTPISVAVLTAEDLPDYMAQVAADEDSAFAVALRAAYVSRPGMPTLMALGDSLTANGGGAINPSTLLVEPSYNPVSYTFWAHLLSGGRFLHAGDAATGGYTSAQIRDTHLPTVLARKPAYCVTLVGQNSQTDLATPVQIWEALIAAGITPILCTLPATGTTAALWKFNQFVTRYAMAHGLPLVDFHAATVNPTTGGYKAGFSSDGTHQTEAGAKAMGQALADVLARIIPNPATAGVLADTNAAADLVVGNPLMLTDDGGGVATNWMGLAAFNGTFTTNPAVAGRLWTVAAPSSADSAVGTVFNVVPGHRYQIAAKLSANVETVGGVWVLRFLSVAPTVNFYTLAEFSKDVPVGSAYAIEWVCPPTIATVRFDILAKTAAGAAMSIGQFTVRDLTALGLT